MSREITIAAEPREGRGKNEARRLRARGAAPAVLYGSGGSSVAVAVDPKEVNRILRSKSGPNTIFDVSVTNGETTPAMIVDWQHDPVKSTLLHVDLKRIDLSQRIRVNVPVHTLGDPQGVPILVSLLKDPEVNYVVPWSLGQIGDQAAVGPLVNALDDDSPSMRVLAIYALETLNAKEALPRLISLLDDHRLSNFGAQASVADAARAAIAKLR